jgi:hypothetical protein
VNSPTLEVCPLCQDTHESTVTFQGAALYACPAAPLHTWYDVAMKASPRAMGLDRLAEIASHLEAFPSGHNLAKEIFAAYLELLADHAALEKELQSVLDDRQNGDVGP